MTTGIRTIRDTEIALDDAKLDGLRAGLRGSLLHPGDDGYDAARSVWNAMIDKRPALIVQPTGAADVADAVRFAREHELLFAVKGGGHNIAGTAVCNGGLMLDLSRLKGVHVDPATGNTRVQPGCVWGDVDRETQPHGLAVPNGYISTTGVAGLTLGGGFGWTTRSYGLTSDNLLAADVITADGTAVRASADQHPDLFWGLRGGGGNFGVVTSFEFQARPVGPQVMAGMILYPMDQAREVLDFFREFTERSPDELTSLLVLRKAPPAPFLPQEVHGAPVAAIAVCHVGPIEEGERAVRPLKAFGAPIVDLIQPKPFSAHQTMLDAANPHGRHYYWKSDYFGELADAAMEHMIEHASNITSPLSAMLFAQLGGQANRVPEAHSAAGPRDVAYIMNIQGSWLDPAESRTHIDWVRGFWQAMQPHSAGRAYMNFFTADEGKERLRAAYDDASYRRLAELKARWDPTNLFRLNQNIEPSGANERVA